MNNTKTEENVIDYFEKLFPLSSPFVRGIGDDCAVIPKDNGDAYVITTDALVENVHFIKEQISPFDLGYKLVAVNVSDVAAMGCLPRYCFLTLALGKNEAWSWIQQLAAGVKQGCARYGIELLGGDTNGSKGALFLNLTLVGEGKWDKIKYRHSAKAGDIIAVTGFLGDSYGGLRILQEQLPKNTLSEKLLRSHFCPEPSVEKGVWLASCLGVNAMMDLSDGIHTDLGRMVKKSQCGASVETSLLPISQELATLSLNNHWDARQMALTGGEDYCLMVTIAPDCFEQIQRSFYETFKEPLYPIGQITDKRLEVTYLAQGLPASYQLSPFNHFI